MERIFCIYCKKTIEISVNDSQICPNCAEILKVPQAELFNGVFILKNEASALRELEKLLKEKIYFKGLHEITTNSFEVNDKHSITILKLNNNNILVLPVLLNEFKNLAELKITSRSLTTVDENFQPPNLNELSFFSCPFIVIPKALIQCTSLKSLWISGSKITSIPKAIGKLINLECLKLNNNKIKSINTSVRNLQKLSILDVGCNFIDELPSVLVELENLTILKVHVNNLDKLPEDINKLHKLQVLEIYCNFLTRLPQLPLDLKYLDVSSNFNLELTENLEEFKDLRLLNVGGNTKINLSELKKVLNESSLVSKLSPLAPTSNLLEK